MKKIAVLFILLSTLLPFSLSAQTTTGAFQDSLKNLDTLEEKTTGRAPSDPDRLNTVVANIVQVAIGLVGILMIILTVYAGFLYMTARGNTEQVERAQSYIKNAIIGIIIVLMAYSFTIFIVQELTRASFDNEFRF